jgi:DNA-binding transcriptional regulator YiaG
MSNDEVIHFQRELRDIRAIVDQLPRSANGKRVGVSDELRSRILDLRKWSRLSGQEFADAIGFGVSVICKWEKKQTKSASVGRRFKRLRVKSVTAPAEVETSPQAIRVEGPSGLKFSMHPAELADLLRMLAC